MSTDPATAFPPTRTLEDIVPEYRPKFEALLAHAESLGLKPKLREVGRTCATQEKYKAKGASAASLCRSAHIFGHAVDLDLTPNNCATHTKLGEWWEAQGGVWGGRWTKIFPGCGDMGHYHWLPDGGQATSEELCPKDITLEQCEQIREQYLTQAMAWTPKSKSKASSWGWLLMTGVVAGAAGVVWYRKRKS